MTVIKNIDIPTATTAEFKTSTSHKGKQRRSYDIMYMGGGGGGGGGGGEFYLN